MTVKDVVKSLEGKIRTGEEYTGREVTGVYVCDLLSWVMSHAQKGNVWVTVHTHLNIVAVALLAEISCIIIPEGINIEDNTVKKALDEGIVILSSDLSAYDVCCRIYEMMKNS
jgi:hypothetical protein